MKSVLTLFKSEIKIITYNFFCIMFYLQILDNFWINGMHFFNMKNSQTLN